MKSKEAEEQIELRRLRTENRLLRQRIDMLEQVPELTVNMINRSIIVRDWFLVHVKSCL